MTLLVAPVAVLLGVVVRGETVTGPALVGFLLLAAGLLVLSGRLRYPLAKAVPPG